MNSPLPQEVTLPRPPGLFNDVPMSDGLRKRLNQISTFLSDLTRMLTIDLSQIHGQINTAVQGVGDDIASAPTITLSHPIHVVTGTAAIDTITVPQQFSGPVMLIPQAAWTMTTTGNIAAPVVAVPNRTVICVFNPRTNLWYPT